MKTSPTQNQPAQQMGGFPCPRCKNPIRFPFQALLTQSSITCPNCGLELLIDPQRSAAALQDLRRYAAGLDEAQRKLDEGKPG